jgi:Ca2+-binding RTX toxin-like protein
LDTIVFESGSIRLNLNKQNFQNYGSDRSRFRDIENVVTSDGGDKVVGSSEANVLDLGSGNDILLGMGGDDRLIGGLGNDRIQGGSGIDTVVFGDVDTRVNLEKTGFQNTGSGMDRIREVENVETGSGNDVIVGDAANNQIISGAGNDNIVGGLGDDLIIAGLGNDLIEGGLGHDTVVFGDADISVDLSRTGFQTTGEGRDRIREVESVETGLGSDRLTGSDVGNVLDAGAGNDILSGRSGDDLLIGGSGDDILTGGDGSDVFRFYRSEGLSTDTIKDFDANDLIELVDDTGEASVAAQITDGANGSTVTWDELTIVFEGAYINYDDINPIS